MAFGEMSIAAIGGTVEEERSRPSFQLYRSYRRASFLLAHLDHDPTNNNDRNLAALCQRCDMFHDADEHRRRRWQNAFRRRAMGDLYLGRYPNW
jgi:hypothetical protein